MPRRNTANLASRRTRAAAAAGALTGFGAYRSVRIPRAPRANPMAITGRGFYKGFGKDLGRFLGGSVSKLTGIPGLSNVGEHLGGYGSKLTGWGAYKLNRNTLITPDVPKMMNANKEGFVQIRHREYIGDVLSSNQFNVQYSIPLQPGLVQSFPWLAPIANQFTQWQPNGILVEFVSTSGSAIASTNNALGEVVMATQYDSIAPPFVNKQQMLNQEFAVSGVPSSNHIHPIECAKQQSQIQNFYTRSNAVPTGSDQRLYDLGVLYIATQGQQQAGVTLGELYITYDILLAKPQLSESLGEEVPTAHIICGGTIAPATPFGTTQNVVYDNINIDLVVDPVTHDASIQLPAGAVGEYMVQWTSVVDATNSGFGSTSAHTNITTLDLFNNQSTWISDSPPLVAGTYIRQQAFKVVESNLSSVCGLGNFTALVSTNGHVDVYVTQLNYNNS